MRFPAVSALLALNCALSVRSAPVTTGNPSGLSLAKRSSEMDAINIQIETMQQQDRTSQMDEQNQLNEQLAQISAEKDMKKKEEEQQRYEELKQTIDKEQQQHQMELQSLLDKQKELEEQEKEEQERIEAQLEKAKEMRDMDSYNHDKNFVVIVIQIVIVVNHNGGWAPPRYETMTQVSYNQLNATTVQTQWITDSVVQYVTEGSPEETMAENSMSAVAVETSVDTAMAMGTAVYGSLSKAMSSTVESIPPMTMIETSAQATSSMLNATTTSIIPMYETAISTAISTAEVSSMIESPVQSIVSTYETATTPSSMAEAPTSSAAYMAESPIQTMTSVLMNYLPTTTSNVMAEVPIETAMVGSATEEATTNIYGQVMMSEVPTETVSSSIETATSAMYDVPMQTAPTMIEAPTAVPAMVETSTATSAMMGYSATDAASMMYGTPMAYSP